MKINNSELEGIADCQFLMEQDKIQRIPPGLADIFGLCSEVDDDHMEEQENVSSVFSENPFCGNRVRQSGTMGNDLYVKNRWMLMGIIGSFESSEISKKESHSKRMKTASSGNSKLQNPALI